MGIKFKYFVLFISCCVAGISPLLGNDTLKIRQLIDSAKVYMFSDIDKSLSILEDAVSLSLKTKHYDKLIECYTEETFISLSKNSIGIYTKNLNNFENAFNQYKNYLGPEAEEYGRHLLNAKIYLYGLIGDYAKTLQLLKEQYQNTPKQKNIDNNALFYMLLNISSLELKLGNYQNAIQYYQKTLSFQNTYFPNGHLRKLMIYDYLGFAYLYLKNYEEAEKMTHYALAEKKLMLKDSVYFTPNSQAHICDLYFIIATLKYEQKQYSRALVSLDSVFSIKNKYNVYTHKLTEYYKLKGKIFLDLKKYDQAMVNFDLAAKITRQDFGPRHYLLSNIYLQKAKLCSEQNNKTTSLYWTQAALVALSQQFNSQDWRDNPSVSDVFSKKDLLETLDFKAQLLLSMSKTNLSRGSGMQAQYLEGAFKTAQLAAGLIDIIRADYTSDFDKQYLADWSYGVYEKNIETAFQLYQNTHNPIYTQTAFGALERSKAIVLLDALRTGQAESALSEGDRNKLYEYKTTLQKLEKQIYEETVKNKKAPDAPSVQTLQKQLFETRNQYQTLVKRFETQYPAYYRLKFGQNFAQLKDVQTLLPSDGSKVALEYFVGDSAVYTFLISKNDCQIFKKEKPKDFDKRIKTMREALGQQDNLHRIAFIRQATWLFDMLLKGPLSKQSSQLTKLLIIPDGILNYVPFDMLFDAADLPPSPNSRAASTVNNSDIPYNKLPFLIKKYVVSYAYSGNLLLLQNKIKEHHAPRTFAGFTAHYHNDEKVLVASASNTTRDKPYELKHAMKEVMGIQRLLGGSVFEKEGEHQFKENAQIYQILHFSMHAATDDDNPQSSKLLFTYSQSDTLEDNDLLASEIYAMRLNADLAVLSACETGYGKINRGEGVMSLSRAFTYAGVNATVMSLWRVDDRTTSEIMLSFYENLKRGQDKEEALRNAKLTFLHNNRSSDMNNPDFWAGFVVVGNMSAIDMTSHFRLQILILTCLASFVALVLYLWWKKNGKNKHN